MFTRTLLLLAAILLHIPVYCRDNSFATQAKPLLFIENKGQVTDQHGRVCTGVDYRLNSGSLNVFISAGKLQYVFSKKDGKHYKTYRLEVLLNGANVNAAASATGGDGYYENYYYAGNNGITAHSFDKISYRNIYANIDWVLYIKNGKLEYDFIAHPGADISQIDIRYKGADALKKLPDGSVVANTVMGNIKEQAPYCYEKETGKTIVAAFKVRGRRMGFDVADYDGTLVLDPKIIWGTYYGDSMNDYNYQVSCDAVGNIYMAGYTWNKYNMVTSGSHQASFAGGNTDGIIVKFNSNGTRKWATYYGGSGDDYITAVKCDQQGYVYISGTTNSSSGIATTGSHKSIFSGGINSDAFLVKFDSTGLRQWGTYYGDTAVDACYGMDISDPGYVYICGSTASKINIATAGTHKDTLSGATDGYIVKFNSNGIRQWGTYYGGDSLDAINGICADDSGNIYVNGETKSINGITTTGCYQSNIYTGAYPNGYGKRSGLVAKLNAGGQRVWGTYYGGTDMYMANIVYSRKGGIFTTTECDEYNTVNMATANAHQTKKSRLLLSRFDVNGGVDWATYYAGLSGYGCFNPRIALDTNGNVVFAGVTGDSVGIATPGNNKDTVDAINAFITKFSANGDRIWGTYYGGKVYGITWVDAVACDNQNNIYLAGNTDCDDGIATPGAFKTTRNQALIHYGSFYSPNSDAFLAKFGNDTSVYIRQPFTDTVLCSGASFNLPYNTNGTFNTGNVFTVQLSDTNGSFASPVTIGTWSAVSGPGFISCVLPGSTYISDKYRIRIVASNPSFISSENPRRIRIIAGISSATAVSNSPLCAGDTLWLTASSMPANLVYTWAGPNGFSASGSNIQVPNVMVVNSGSYNLTTSAAGCASKLNIINVVVDSIIHPAITISQSPSVYTLGSTVTFNAVITDGGSGYTLQWYRNGIAIPGATSNPFVTNVLYYNDVISLEYKSPNKCALPDSLMSQSIVLLSIRGNDVADGVVLSPNPNNGSFAIDINTIKEGTITAEVINLYGEVVYREKIDTNGGRVHRVLDIGKVPAGTYMLRLRNGSIQKMVKFTVFN